MDFLKGDIWCISLKNNAARYLNSQNEFKKVSLNNIKYHRPKRDSRSGKIGCWNSHIHCMNESLKNNKNNNSYVTIFEDDIEFINGWETQIDNIKQFLTSEPRWDIFRLGCLFKSLTEPSISTPNVWRGKSLNCHAWILNLSFVRKLLENPIMFTPEKIIGFSNNFLTKDRFRIQA